MSIIKQISVFDGSGSSWEINDIGANAGNIDLIAPSSTVTTNLAGSSNLFTALNNILPTDQLTASRVVLTDANKKLTTSNITSTLLGFLTGVTGSPIQTQINTLKEIFEPAETVIPENSNLNNYTNPGAYRISSAEVATTLSNLPYPVAGRIEVKCLLGTGRFMQTFYPNAGGVIGFFLRRYTSDGWTDWRMYQDALGTEITTLVSNLNSLRLPGRYYCSTSALAQSLSNCPTTTNFVMLQFLKGSNIQTSYRVQVIFSGSTAIFTRTESSSGWSQWYKYTGTAV